VYYRRTALTGDGGEREADYELDIGRKAGATCSAAPMWSWRGRRRDLARLRFSETQPR